jgi:hypothetical protein
MALMGNFLDLKPSAVIVIDRRFPQSQARGCHWPRQAIFSASSSELSLVLIDDFLGLKPGAVIGLDG